MSVTLLKTLPDFIFNKMVTNEAMRKKLKPDGRLVNPLKVVSHQYEIAFVCSELLSLLYYKNLKTDGRQMNSSMVSRCPHRGNVSKLIT
jgi:hypothetical protein